MVSYPITVPSLIQNNLLIPISKIMYLTFPAKNHISSHNFGCKSGTRFVTIMILFLIFFSSENWCYIEVEFILNKKFRNEEFRHCEKLD